MKKAGYPFISLVFREKKQGCLLSKVFPIFGTCKKVGGQFETRILSLPLGCVSHWKGWVAVPTTLNPALK